MPHVLLLLAALGVASCRLAGPDDPSRLADSLVVRSGTSFGECLGYCVTELELRGGRAVLIQRGQPSSEFPDRMLERPLPDSVAVAVDGRLDLAWFFTLDPVFGCPDCADGGAEWIEVEDAGSARRVTFEYRAPPDGLQDLARILRAYRDALVREFD